MAAKAILAPGSKVAIVPGPEPLLGDLLQIAMELPESSRYHSEKIKWTLGLRNAAEEDREGRVQESRETRARHARDTSKFRPEEATDDVGEEGRVVWQRPLIESVVVTRIGGPNPAFICFPKSIS